MATRIKVEQPFLLGFITGGARQVYFDDQSVDTTTGGVPCHMLMAGIGLASLHLEKLYRLCNAEATAYQEQLLAEMIT